MAGFPAGLFLRLVGSRAGESKLSSPAAAKRRDKLAFTLVFDGLT
jgi:hypothetical protein